VEYRFVDVRGASLHVRTAGRGPAVLMLHQAPTSARVMESLITHLADSFFCIAPDLPGLGRSDPITNLPVTIEKVARVIGDLLDVYGIEKFIAYGSHTGALVATELAIQRPQAVAAIVVNGYPIYTLEESAQRLATYFPPIDPVWDGSHLIWLWYRYREQFIYWPWNTKHPITRANCPLPNTAYLHAGVAEIAVRHDCYANLYAAAFDYDASGALARNTVQLHMVIDPEDSLSLKVHHAARDNKTLRLREIAAGQSVEAVEYDLLGEIARTSSLLARSLPGDEPRSDAMRYWGAERRIVSRRIVGANKARLCVVLPDFPGGFTALAAELPSQCPSDVMLLDFSGLAIADESPDRVIAGFSAAVDDLIESINAPNVDLIAHHSTAGLAAVTKAKLGKKCGRVAILDPLPGAQPAPFDATLCASGGHLLRLWDRIRFRRLTADGMPNASSERRMGLYEDLGRIGRLSWDAVSSFAIIPAVERALATLQRDAEELVADPTTLCVFSGVDHLRFSDAIPKSASTILQNGPPKQPLADALRAIASDHPA